MQLLIDADSAIYKAGFANETRGYIVFTQEGQVAFEHQYKKVVDAWMSSNGEEGEFVLEKTRTVGPLAHSLANVKAVCANMTAIKHDSYRMFIGGKGNFRYDIYPAYKGLRTADGKPLHNDEIKDYLVKHWNAERVDDEEADDVVSYLQMEAGAGDNTCIVSIDKDLLNTPGWNYNYDKELLQYISEEQANLTFARQLLTGDPTDHIPGLKRYGKKKAEVILPMYVHDWQDIVAEHYERQYGDDWLEVLNVNGQLLWMRREREEIWEWDGMWNKQTACEEET